MSKKRRRHRTCLAAPSPGELWSISLYPNSAFLVTGVEYLGRPFMQGDTWRVTGMMDGGPFSIDWAEWDPGWTRLTGRIP